MPGMCKLIMMSVCFVILDFLDIFSFMCSLFRNMKLTPLNLIVEYRQCLLGLKFLAILVLCLGLSRCSWLRDPPSD